MSEPRWRRTLRLHGPDPRADVREELEFHLSERAEELMAAGMSEQDAREEARRRFGDVDRAIADLAELGARRVRRMRWSDRLGSVAQDVRYALATARRAPGFSAAVVATITLGVGANAAVFSLLNALLLQPLDAREPRQLVRVYTSEGRALRSASDRYGGSSYADYSDLRRAKTLSGLVASMPAAVNLRLGRGPARFEGRIVSEDYFDVLGRPPLIGGWSRDASAGVEAFISHRLWRAEFAGDPRIVGRAVEMNGRLVRVAGVTAPSFRGIEPSRVDVYLPLRSAPLFTGRAGFLTDRGERSLRLFGRLAPGASAADAERDLNGVMRALAAESPATNRGRVVSVREARSVVPLELAGDGALPTAALVFAATLAMLAVAGVNVASVFLARTLRRRRELAIRTSLGASRWRLVRQLVTEAMTLALASAAVVLALLALLPLLAERLGVPPAVQPGVDLRVLAYSVGVAAAAGLLFGLGPALAGAGADLQSALRGGDFDARPVKTRAQRVLVSAQLALSTALLIVGSALLRGLAERQRIDPGFDLQSVAVAHFEDPSGGVDPLRERAFARLALERLGAAPGVVSLTTASMAPLSGDGMRSSILIPGYQPAADESMEIQTATAGPDFFRTLGIPLRRGRELTWQGGDTLRKVVVNESMARRYWANRDPVGTHVRLYSGEGPLAEVIGVAADTRFLAVDRPPVPMFVVQRAAGGGSTLLVRARGDAALLLPTVRGALSRGDVPLTLVRLRTMSSVLDESMLAARAVTGTLLCVGGLAILLASVGLYGVVSYATGGRMREFAIRLALGATPASIRRLVLADGARLVAVGGTAGAVLGVIAMNAAPVAHGGLSAQVAAAAAVSGILALVTALACLVPASRAARSAPLAVLASE